MVEETNMGKEIDVFPKENYYTLVVKSGVVRQFSQALHRGDMDVIQYFLKKCIDLESILGQIKDKKGSLYVILSHYFEPTPILSKSN